MFNMRDFSVLSDVEFEHLVGDLLSAELGVPVERFAAGADGGIDLRWPTSEGIGVGQCKHYQRSTYAQLYAAAKKEVDKPAFRDSQEYKLITSFDLSPTQKQRIYDLFSEKMSSPEDVLGGSDVTSLLARHQGVERAHPKLWVTTGMQLFWSSHADILNRSGALKRRIEKSIPKYVVNEGYARARNLLEEHSVCIISGVPGIGKTMLAQMLIAEYVASGFAPVEVSQDVNEAWVALNSEAKQVFFYDDFLGQITFGERLGKNEDRRLSELIEIVRESPEKKLILTTREYILRDAQFSYERLRDLDGRHHFVLALAHYNRRDRAQILYNHLWHSDLSAECLREIACGGYKPIVDHPSYSPRLVEYCTGKAFDLVSPGYPQRVVDTLTHPKRLWRTAFDKHLTLLQRLFIVGLATHSPRVDSEVLEKTHTALCGRFSITLTQSQFRECLEVLEGTFISIGRRTSATRFVAFSDPSITEFVIECIAADRAILSALLASAPSFEQLVSLMTYAKARDEGASKSLYRALEAQLDDFNAALLRTHDTPPVQRLPEAMGIDTAPAERRLAICLASEESLTPSSEVTNKIASWLARRWSAHVGDKTSAAELMRTLPQSRVSESLQGELHDACHAWLQNTLDSPSDWIHYLDHLTQWDDLDLSTQVDCRAAFESAIRSYIAKYDLGEREYTELKYYAEEFGLSGLMDRLDEAFQEEPEEDDYEGSGSTEWRGLGDRGADSDLDALFGRFNSDDT